MAKFYSLKEILKCNADMNIIYGERSNGKTYAVQKYAFEKYCKHGEELAIIRRYREDFRGKLGTDTFNGIVSTGVIDKLTGGVYDRIHVYGGVAYPARYDDNLNKTVKSEKPFAHFFSLASAEHYKSTNYENVTTILFDEFVTRNGYFNDEVQMFFSVVSTIVRHRGNVKIFMLGNSVNKYGCPYFDELGIYNIQKQQQGTIDTYTNNNGLKIAVEYTAPTQGGKKSDKYFTFDNPRTKMITGGVWECNQYPRLTFELKKSYIYYTFYVDYNDIIVSGNICRIGSDVFIFFHKKTTKLQDRPTDVIYTINNDTAHNHLSRLGSDRLSGLINKCISANKIFFADNDTGELIRNWYMWQHGNSVLS